MLSFKSGLLRQFGNSVIDIRLFGSRARGEGHEESDLDIAVIVKQESGNLRREIYDLAADIYLKDHINLSPLVLSKEKYDWLLSIERGIALAIEQEGIKL